MPELPEVETVVRDLRPLLVGQSFSSMRVGGLALRKAWDPTWERELVGRRVEAIERRGKWIQLDLGGPWLLVHLGMTGQFTVAPIHEPRASHTHFVFPLSPSCHELRFRDIRRFGSITLFPNRDALLAYFVGQHLGPEPFDLDNEYFRSRLQTTRRNLKAILLDQTVVAGVGNIYADESLFVAKLPPTKLGTDLKPRQVTRLRDGIVQVLTHAIECRGSTIRDYVGGSGLMGKFQNEFRVYGRTGEPCLQCGTPIQRIVLASRSTHFCPKCQQG